MLGAKLKAAKRKSASLDTELATPIKTKADSASILQGTNISIKTFHASHIGLRPRMEDHYSVKLKLSDCSYVGLFDGHGGEKCSKFLSKKLIDTIQHQETWQTDPILAIQAGCSALDERFKKKHSTAGSTAVAVIFKDKKIYIVNVGDSRCIMVSRTAELLFSTRDHKPDDPEEKTRILDAGGNISAGRIEGRIAVARAFGDFIYKDRGEGKPDLVTVEPDVTVFDLSDDLHFVLLACDGVWDVLTNKEVVGFVERRIRNEVPPSKIVEELVQHSLDRRSTDNVSVLLVLLDKA